MDVHYLSGNAISPEQILIESSPGLVEDINQYIEEDDGTDAIAFSDIIFETSGKKHPMAELVLLGALVKYVNQNNKTIIFNSKQHAIENIYGDSVQEEDKLEDAVGVIYKALGKKRTSKTDKNMLRLLQEQLDKAYASR